MATSKENKCGCTDAWTGIAFRSMTLLSRTPETVVTRLDTLTPSAALRRPPWCLHPLERCTTHSDLCPSEHPGLAPLMAGCDYGSSQLWLLRCPHMAC